MGIRPNIMAGFVQELTLIKMAEEQAKEEERKTEGWKLRIPEAMEAIKNLALGAGAYAAGAAAVRLAEPKLREVFSNIRDPAKIKLLGQGVGLAAAASSLALMDAIQQNARMVRESSKSDR